MVKSQQSILIKQAVKAIGKPKLSEAKIFKDYKVAKP